MSAFAQQGIRSRLTQQYATILCAQSLQFGRFISRKRAHTLRIQQGIEPFLLLHRRCALRHFPEGIVAQSIQRIYLGADVSRYFFQWW